MAHDENSHIETETVRHRPVEMGDVKSPEDISHVERVLSPDDLKKDDMDFSRVDKEIQMYAARGRVEVDEATNKRLKRLIDRRVLAIMICTYFLQALDKGTMSFASIMGIKTDADLEKGQRVSLFRVTNSKTMLTIAVLLAHNLYLHCCLDRRVSDQLDHSARSHRQVSRHQHLSLGHSPRHACCLQELPRTSRRANTPGYLRSLLPAYLCLAVFDVVQTGGTGGDGDILVGPPSIQLKPTGHRSDNDRYMMNGAQQIVGGLLAYCFTLIGSDKVIKSWQALFLAYGCLSVLWGLFVIFWMPDSPMRAKCFTEEDKHLMVERLRSNQTGIQNKEFRAYQMWEALRDPQTWCYCSIQLFTTLPTSGLGAFAGIIMKGFNFTTLESQLLAMVLGFYIIVILLTSAWLVKKFNQNLLVMLGFVIPYVKPITTSCVETDRPGRILEPSS